MLEGLDDIPWAELQHAYGSARDVPAALRQLASEDPVEAEDGLSNLMGSIWHQGTVYEATVPAVPYLIEVLGTPDCTRRPEVLMLLALIADGTSYLEVHLKPVDERRSDPAVLQRLARQLDYVKRSKEAVWKGLDQYMAGLSHESPNVRTASVWVLGNLYQEAFEEGTTVATSHQGLQSLGYELGRRITSDPADFPRASMVYVLGIAAQKNHELADALSALVTSDLSQVVRLVAAVQTLTLNSSHEPARQEICSALADWDDEETVFTADHDQWPVPWFDSDPLSDLVEALCRLPAEYLPALAPAFERLLRDMPGHTVQNLCFSILPYVLGERPLEEYQTVNDLSPEQVRILSILYDHPEAWTRIFISQSGCKSFFTKENRSYLAHLLGRVPDAKPSPLTPLQRIRKLLES